METGWTCSSKTMSSPESVFTISSRRACVEIVNTL